jgi:hypothetical protein
MLIKYKIISTNPAEHSLVVRFYTDTITEEFLAVRNPDTGEIIRNADGTIKSCRTEYNITLWGTPTVSGTALHELILSNAPRAWFELLTAIADPTVDTDMTSAAALVGVEAQGEVATPAPPMERPKMPVSIL